MRRFALLTLAVATLQAGLGDARAAEVMHGERVPELATPGWEAGRLTWETDLDVYLAPYMEKAGQHLPPGQWRAIESVTSPLFGDLRIHDSPSDLITFSVQSSPSRSSPGKVSGHGTAEEKASPASPGETCLGEACAPSVAERAGRSLEDQQLVDALRGLRTDVKDLLRPATSFYEDSRIRDMFEALRDHGSSAAVAGVYSYSSPDTGVGDPGSHVQSQSRGGSTQREQLAAIRMLFDVLEILRDFGPPLLVLFLVFHLFVRIARARQA